MSIIGQGAALDGSFRGARASSSLVYWSVSALILTSIHHAYGAVRYGTPWRFHVLLITIPAIVLTVRSGARMRKHVGVPRAKTLLFGITLGVTVLCFGVFEGAYNHLAKDVLFFAGAPPSFMFRLFPPPTYEMPNDIFFEATGIAQAMLTIVVVQRLFGLRQRSDASPRYWIDALSLPTMSGETIKIPDPRAMVHLQFRRFAGCPVCEVHLRAFVRREPELVAEGIREVVVFHSTEASLRQYVPLLPFPVVADPQKKLYAAFGVEEGARALLHPRAWLGIGNAVVRTLAATLLDGAPFPPLDPGGGRTTLPADFLIASDGRVLAHHFGEHVDDAWSVDALLEHAKEP